MNTQTGTAQPLWRPRPLEDRETVRRQQKELRRIRQRVRRDSMTEAQIEQRRERGREYYLRRKIHKLMKRRDSRNVPAPQPRVDRYVECTTAEQIKEQIKKPEYASQCQQNGNLDVQLLMKQTEQSGGVLDEETLARCAQSVEFNLRRKRNRLTNVKREARTRHKEVRPLRIIHIKREARKLGNGVVDRTRGNGNYFSKFGNIPDKNGSISLVREHAQILIDISRMKGCSSAAIVANAKRSLEIELNEGANNKCAKVYNGDALDKDDDSEQTATDGEGTDSESEEVIAFLTGLSAKRGQC